MPSLHQPAAAFSVRPCLPQEAAALAGLAARLFVQAYGPTHPEPELSAYLARTFDPARLATELTRARVRVFLAENGAHELVGYAYLRESENNGPPRASGQTSCEILRFYVDEAWHGRGVASALMQECERAARQWGASALWVQAWSAAARPIAFYRKAGFRIVGTTEFHFGERVDTDYLMSRELESPLTPG
jgi:ribosomal protein S18 acetylase RimI-like enzyme